MRMSVLATCWATRIHNGMNYFHIIDVVWGGEIDMMSRVERNCVVRLEQSRMGNRPRIRARFIAALTQGKWSNRLDHVGLPIWDGNMVSQGQLWAVDDNRTNSFACLGNP